MKERCENAMNHLIKYFFDFAKIPDLGNLVIIANKHIYPKITTSTLITQTTLSISKSLQLQQSDYDFRKIFEETKRSW